MWKYILAWVPMVLIAIANAVLRENVFAKRLSELQAHQVSTATGVLLFSIYIWVITRIWRPESPGRAFIIGLTWLGLTVAFEFLFGHFVMRHPWSRLFHDYNVFIGRLWVIVLIWVALAPYAFYRLQK
jgi:hypothetical protein